jgi:hypothetical protein
LEIYLADIRNEQHIFYINDVLVEEGYAIYVDQVICFLQVVFFLLLSSFFFYNKILFPHGRKLLNINNLSHSEMKLVSNNICLCNKYIKKYKFTNGKCGNPMRSRDNFNCFQCTLMIQLFQCMYFDDGTF